MSKERKNTPDQAPPSIPDGRLSRRRFLQGVALSAGAAAVPAEGLLARAAANLPAAPEPTGPGPVPVVLTVNGKEIKLSVEPRITLLEALRDHLDLDTHRHVDLTGTKRVCDRASCGACTVIMNGRSVYACSILAIDAQGKKIETVENLEKDGKPHVLQTSFVEKDALQCGFCTCGFLMASKALLDRNPYPSREEIVRALSGNICRCGTQPRLIEAVEHASENLRIAKGG